MLSIPSFIALRFDDISPSWMDVRFGSTTLGDHGPLRPVTGDEWVALSRTADHDAKGLLLSGRYRPTAPGTGRCGGEPGRKARFSLVTYTTIAPTTITTPAQKRQS